LLNENEDLGETTTMSVTSIMELLEWMFDLTYCEYGGSHFVLIIRQFAVFSLSGGNQ